MDFGSMSDEELERIANGGVVGATRAGMDFSKMSDEELERIARGDGPLAVQAPKPGEYGQMRANGVRMRPEDFADRGARGAIESAMLDVQRDTGADASWGNAALDAVAGVAYNAIGKGVLSAANKNMQRLAKGVDAYGVPLEQLPDNETDYLMDAIGANGMGGWFRRFLGAGASGAWRGEDNIMRRWDETDGAKIADPAARKRARVAYAREIALGMIGQTETAKQRAAAELEGREETALDTAARGLVEQGGYSLPYMAQMLLRKNPLVFALTGANEGVTRYNELVLDRLGVDADGNVRVEAEGDDFSVAATEGLARGITAPAIEMFGGTLAMKAGGRLLGATVGKVPLFRKAGERIVATKAGRAVEAYARRMRLFGRLTGMQGAPEEFVEELEDQVLDAAFGTDRRESEKRADETWTDRAGKAFSDFFKGENLKELALSMSLMQVLGGAAGYAQDRAASRHIDGILREAVGVDASELKYYTAEEKEAAFRAWADGLSEDEIARHFNKGAKQVGRMVETIRRNVGENEFAQADADAPTFNAPMRTTGDGQTLADGNGNPIPDFRETTDDAGRPVMRLYDAKSGIAIDRVDMGDGEHMYRVTDAQGRVRAAESYGQAVARANQMLAGEHLSSAKRKYLESLTRPGRILSGVDVVAGDSLADVMDEIAGRYGEKAAASVRADPDFAQGSDGSGQSFAFVAPNGSKVAAFVLDNIGTVEEAATAANHEAGRHLGLDMLFDTPEKKRAFLEKFDGKDRDVGAMPPDQRRRFDQVVEQVRRDYGLARRADVFADPKAAEELFAYFTEGQFGNAPLRSRFVAALRGAYRSLFDADLGYGEDELLAVAQDAARAARQGAGGGMTYRSGIERQGREEMAGIENRRQGRRVLREQEERRANAPAQIPYDPAAPEGTTVPRLGYDPAQTSYGPIVTPQTRADAWKSSPNPGQAWGEVVRSGASVLSQMRDGRRSQEAAENGPASAPPETRENVPPDRADAPEGVSATVSEARGRAADRAQGMDVSEANVRWRVGRGEHERWNRTLDAYERGEFDSTHHAQVFSQAPAILRRLGARDLPITISGGVLKKIVGEIETSSGDRHGIPVSELRNLQIELDNPIAVFDSASRDDSLVVLTRMIDRANNERAVVALRLDQSGAGATRINTITSAYGKNKSSFEKWVADRRLRYVNKEARNRSARWLQLPGDSKFRALDVLTEKDFPGEELGRIVPDSAAGRKGVSEEKNAATRDDAGNSDLRWRKSVPREVEDAVARATQSGRAEAIDVPWTRRTMRVMGNDLDMKTSKVVAIPPIAPPQGVVRQYRSRTLTAQSKKTIISWLDSLYPSRNSSDPFTVKTRDGETVHFWDKGKSEFLMSRNSLNLMRFDKKAWKAKLALIPNLPLVIKSAVVIDKRVPEKYPHKGYKSYYKGGFDYYGNQFAYRDGNGNIGTYNAVILLNRHLDGTVYFYDAIVANSERGTSNNKDAFTSTGSTANGTSLPNTPSAVNGVAAKNFRFANESNLRWRRAYRPDATARAAADHGPLTRREADEIASVMPIRDREARAAREQASRDAFARAFHGAGTWQRVGMLLDRKTRGDAGRAVRDAAIRKFQDAGLDLRRYETARFERQLGKPAEKWTDAERERFMRESTYHAMDRAYGRKENLSRRLVKDYVEPLQEEIARNGLDEAWTDAGGNANVGADGRPLTKLDMYLMALHGAERNRMIAERTAHFEGGPVTDGSGRTTEYWQRELDRFRAEGFDAKAAEAVRLVREMNRNALRQMVESGRVGKRQADTWNRLSPNYVPLRNSDAANDLFEQLLFGGPADEQTFRKAYGGGEYRHAMGRASLADSPVVNSIQQAEWAIARSVDNESRRSLAAQVRADPKMGAVAMQMSGKDFDEAQRQIVVFGQMEKDGTITPAQRDRLARLKRDVADAEAGNRLLPRRKMLDAQGREQSVIDTQGLEDDPKAGWVAFKEDGETKFVRLGHHALADAQGNPTGNMDELTGSRIARFVKGQSFVRLGGAMRFVRGLSRGFGMLRTSLSPTFLFSNFLADNGQALRNVFHTRGAGAMKTFEGYAANMGRNGARASALRYLRGTLDPARYALDRYTREWAENGGQIGGFATESFGDIDERMAASLRRIQRRLSRGQGGRAAAVKDAMAAIGERFQEWNAAIEMATRIAAYATMRENGMGVNDAVSYARDVTVNFNRKGEWTPLFNALYVFSNANIQDMQRTGLTFTGPRAVRLNGALFMLGILSAALGFGQDGPDDETEGGDTWDNTSEWRKQNGISFRVGGKVVSLPLRGLARMPYYAGHKAFEVLTGRRGAAEVAGDIGAFALSAATEPISATSSLAQSVAPSVLRPAVELVENKSFTGAPIHRTKASGTQVASEMGRQSTSGAAVWLARTLNSLTGGNRNRSGAVDVFPETLEQIGRGLAGTLGTDIAKGVELARDIATFRAPETRDIPFVSRVASDMERNSRRYHEAVTDFERDQKEYRDLAQEDPSVLAGLRRKSPWFVKGREAWYNELDSLRKLTKKLLVEEARSDGDARKELNDLRMKTQGLFLWRLKHAPESDAPDRRAEHVRRNRLIDRMLRGRAAERKREEKRIGASRAMP